MTEGKHKALIILGHIPSEQAGMKECTQWLKGFIDEVPVSFFPAAEPFWAPESGAIGINCGKRNVNFTARRFEIIGYGRGRDFGAAHDPGAGGRIRTPHGGSGKSCGHSFYAPKFFPAHQYKTLQALCQTIIPADSDSGGAVEAGDPEFINLDQRKHRVPSEAGRRVNVARRQCSDRYGSSTLIARRNSRKKFSIRLLIAITRSQIPA